MTTLSSKEIIEKILTEINIQKENTNLIPPELKEEIKVKSMTGTLTFFKNLKKKILNKDDIKKVKDFKEFLKNITYGYTLQEFKGLSSDIDYDVIRHYGWIKRGKYRTELKLDDTILKEIEKKITTNYDKFFGGNGLFRKYNALKPKEDLSEFKFQNLKDTIDDEKEYNLNILKSIIELLKINDFTLGYVKNNYNDILTGYTIEHDDTENFLKNWAETEDNYINPHTYKKYMIVIDKYFSTLVISKIENYFHKDGLFKTVPKIASFDLKEIEVVLRGSSYKIGKFLQNKAKSFFREAEIQSRIVKEYFEQNKSGVKKSSESSDISDALYATLPANRRDSEMSLYDIPISFNKLKHHHHCRVNSYIKTGSVDNSNNVFGENTTVSNIKFTLINNDDIILPNELVVADYSYYSLNIFEDFFTTYICKSNIEKEDAENFEAWNKTINSLKKVKDANKGSSKYENLLEKYRTLNPLFNGFNDDFIKNINDIPKVKELITEMLIPAKNKDINDYLKKIYKFILKLYEKIKIDDNEQQDQKQIKECLQQYNKFLYHRSFNKKKYIKEFIKKLNEQELLIIYNGFDFTFDEEDKIQEIFIQNSDVKIPYLKFFIKPQDPQNSLNLSYTCGEHYFDCNTPKPTIIISFTDDKIDIKNLKGETDKILNKLKTTKSEEGKQTEEENICSVKYEFYLLNQNNSKKIFCFLKMDLINNDLIEYVINNFIKLKNYIESKRSSPGINETPIEYEMVLIISSVKKIKLNPNFSSESNLIPELIEMHFINNDKNILLTSILEDKDLEYVYVYYESQGYNNYLYNKPYELIKADDESKYFPFSYRFFRNTTNTNIDNLDHSIKKYPYYQSDIKVNLDDELLNKILEVYKNKSLTSFDNCIFLKYNNTYYLEEKKTNNPSADETKFIEDDKEYNFKFNVENETFKDGKVFSLLD